MRLFVAADLPDDVREKIAAEQRRIAAMLGGKKREPSRRVGIPRWVNLDHAHLTLVFLGEVDDARGTAVMESIGRDVDLETFEIAFESVGVFPPRGAPRVLWIGIGAGAAPLAALQRELAQRIAALGIALEDRPFHPHLTLARWRDSRPADRARVLQAAPHGVVARARIAGATLYRSTLSSDGPIYTPLARATLIGRT